MKVCFTDSHHFEKEVFDQVNLNFNFDIEYLDFRLNAKTAQALPNCEVVCCFVNDDLNADCLQILKSKGVQLLALRSAGFNHVDLKAAEKLSIQVCRVPNYSPSAVAEFTLGLLLTLNRKIHRAYNRVHELNFSLEGLVGFDLNQKTVGVIGAGKIGRIFVKAVVALGCKVLVCDVHVDPELSCQPSVSYCDLKKLYQLADVISLHVPLSTETRHLINDEAISKMKKGVVIVNTSRGAIIDTTALISGLKTGQIGAAALDVYEEEENIFFQDLSEKGLQDDVLARLLTFPNVLITSHQAFLTKEALTHIATTTCENIREFYESGRPPQVTMVANSR